MRSEINPEITRRRIERPLPLLDQVSSAPSASTAQAATAGKGAVTPSMAPEESGLSTLPVFGAQCETGAASDCSSGKAFTAPEVAHARRGDPQTSHDAAASIVNIGPVRSSILEIFRDHGPLIDEELIEIYHTRERTRRYRIATDQSIRSRRKELERDLGRLICCGAKKNKRKRLSQLWRLA